MSAGSNSVTVGVRGPKGTGSVVVPLVAVAARRLSFNAPLAALLIVAGLFLASGMFTIVGAAVRESVLPPGEEPDGPRRRRARWAMARAVGIFVLAIVGAGAWWRADDADFARRLFRPLAVTTRIEPVGTRSLFRLAIVDSAWTHRNDTPWLRARGAPQLTGLIEDHGKLVHLFLIAADGRSGFAHLHPGTDDTVTFTTTLPPLPAGVYSVFADVVHASGLTETLTSTITLPAPAPPPPSGSLADADDAWSPGQRVGSADQSVLADGTTLTWVRGGRALAVGDEAGLQFAIASPAGDTAALEPYLGMAGHAVVVRDDGKVFIHLHPLGTISVAAQARLTGASFDTSMRHMMAAPGTQGGTLYFPYAFPQPGDYTLWVQLKRRGRILTGSFTAHVSPKPR
jgi:hypothetical protein